MDTRSRSIRVLMLPWLAHGHISPFLQLAKSLAKRNFVSYICSSRINLDYIKKDLSPKDSISIKLVELQIPATPELPPPSHTTNGLPPHLMAPLKRAFDQARPAFSSLLTTLKPDIVLYDFLQPWAAEEAAAAHNIPAVLFFTIGAAATSLIAHHWLEPSDRGFEYPFPAIYFRESEYEILNRRLVNSGGGDTNNLERIQDCVRRSSEIVLIKSFREIEGKYVDFLCDFMRKKFVPVGPLVRELGQNEENENTIIEWLDRKDRRSTVFASFGSEYFLSENEIEEIAHGLEMSGVNFVWAIRFPAGERNKVDEKLPEGFVERVGERGMVVEGWAPQRRILSRPSVGGFMSHCGWSSVMEGVYSGVPIIAVPIQHDQPLNARLAVEVGFGEEVVRSRGGRLEREEVARVVRKVVVERSGEELRWRVAEMSERMRERGEVELDGMVEEVVRLCRRRERLNLESENSMDRLNAMAEESSERMLSENA